MTGFQRGYPSKHEVCQFHLTSWPEHGVPYHATGLLAFLRRVKASTPPDAGPVVVHCRYVCLHGSVPTHRTNMVEITSVNKRCSFHLLVSLMGVSSWTLGNTKHTLICINTNNGNCVSTTAEASIYNLSCLHSWSYGQSVAREMNGAPGLASLQKPANSLLSSIAPEYFSSPSCIFFTRNIQRKGKLSTNNLELRSTESAIN